MISEDEGTVLSIRVMKLRYCFRIWLSRTQRARRRRVDSNGDGEFDCFLLFMVAFVKVVVFRMAWDCRDASAPTSTTTVVDRAWRTRCDTGSVSWSIYCDHVLMVCFCSYVIARAHKTE